MIPSHGWLAKDPEAPATLAGVSFDWRLPTRKEEYGLLVRVALELEPGNAYDAATGYVPDWHVAPYILANMFWCVDAWDNDPRTMNMPPHSRVWRKVADMNSYQRPVDTDLDLILSISVLEHCELDIQTAFADMASRCLRPGGVLFITADGINPKVWPLLLGPSFDCGEEVPLVGDPLTPEVSYCVATRT